MQISGQAAVVTGGASGLGLATAKMLQAKGAKVAILDLDPLRPSNDFKGPAFKADVADGAALEAAMKEVEGAVGAPRICVHCAGIGTGRRIVGRDGPMPLADFAQVINVNLIGTFNVLRIAAAAMSRQEPVGGEERGVIVTTASIAAFDGQIGQAAYAASKGGVVSLTLPAARELARFGIRVLSIAPGLFDTALWTQLTEEQQKALTAGQPFPKRVGRPDEFALLCCHIVENPMLNGECIRLDAALRLG